MPSSFFAPIFAKYAVPRGATGTTASPMASTGRTSTGGATVAGRVGAQQNGIANAVSDSFQYQKTYTMSTSQQTDTLPLNLESDVIGLQINLAGTAVGVTAGDFLGVLGQWQLLGPDGVQMNIYPLPDFYMLEQRFSPLHVLPTYQVMSATALSAAYTVYGINLPMAAGQYTLLVTVNSLAQAIANGDTGLTGLPLTITISAILGNCVGLSSHYIYSGLPFTPAANGTNDLATVAPIQDVDLTELFLSGMTSNSADINFIQSSSTGARIFPSTLIGRANSKMFSALPSAAGTPTGWVAAALGGGGVLYPLFSLESDLNIGKGKHFYITWGATPAATIRAGFYWQQ